MPHSDNAAGRNRQGWLKTRLANLRNKMQRRSILSEADIEKRFTKTYELNYWGSDESRSGEGSTLRYTENVRRMLPVVIARFNIRSMFDAPCGDFNWMQAVRPALDIDYIGGDIVKPMIDTLTARHQDARTRFIHADITRQPLPAVDLWFCRDCLFHLSYADTRRALENFVASNVPYLLTTTHVNDGSWQNRDIDTGDFRSMDLFAAPYGLPRDVLFRFDDALPPDPGREMCLWSRDQIAAALKTTQL